MALTQDTSINNTDQNARSIMTFLPIDIIEESSDETDQTVNVQDDMDSLLAYGTRSPFVY